MSWFGDDDLSNSLSRWDSHTLLRFLSIHQSLLVNSSRLNKKRGRKEKKKLSNFVHKFTYNSHRWSFTCTDECSLLFSLRRLPLLLFEDLSIYIHTYKSAQHNPPLKCVCVCMKMNWIKKTRITSKISLSLLYLRHRNGFRFVRLFVFF